MTRAKTWRAAGIAIALCAGPAHAGDIRVHGLLDVAAAPRGEAYEHNVLIRGDSPFDPYGLRLFVDSQVGPKLGVFAQSVLRDATNPYVDGAYLMYTPQATRDLHVLAGKVPWAIGTYAPRTYSNKNPLMGTPLMYQYHSSLVWYEIPGDADVLLSAARTGSYGVDYFGYPEGRGMSIVDDSYWDVGVTIAGSERRVEYALGVTQGTPGWGSTAEDENHGKTVLGRFGVAPWPGVRVGVSGAYGPYMVDALNPSLPPGHSVADYHQQLGMADAELLVGHAELRAEGALNVWETPTVGGLRSRSGYAELKYLLGFGAFLAGRYDVLRFSRLTDSVGARRPWDSNVTRSEVGAGYRFTRDAQAKLVLQTTTLGDAGAGKPEKTMSLFGAQLSVEF